jgi:hypothetical protein
VVRRRIKEIEEAARGARDMQPPSLYVSVASPLEVSAIPSSSGSRTQTIFYEVPRYNIVIPCMSFPNLALIQKRLRQQ